MKDCSERPCPEYELVNKRVKRSRRIEKAASRFVDFSIELFTGFAYSSERARKERRYHIKNV